MGTTARAATAAPRARAQQGTSSNTNRRRSPRASIALPVACPPRCASRAPSSIAGLLASRSGGLSLRTHGWPDRLRELRWQADTPPRHRADAECLLLVPGLGERLRSLRRDDRRCEAGHALDVLDPAPDAVRALPPDRPRGPVHGRRHRADPSDLDRRAATTRSTRSRARSFVSWA